MFRIDFQSGSDTRQGRTRRFLILLGLFLLLQVAVYGGLAGRTVWFWPLLLIVALQLMAGFSIVRQRYFIESNGRNLSYNVTLGFRKKRVLPWASIRSVRLGPAYIRLYLVNNRRRQISLGWVTYQDLRDAKTLLMMECQRMGKPYTIVKLAE